MCRITTCKSSSRALNMRQARAPPVASWAGHSAVSEVVFPELGELITDVLGDALIAFCGRPDPERPQQIGGWRPGVACLPEDWVQSLVSQMVKDQVDHSPRVIGLPWLIHGQLRFRLRACASKAGVSFDKNPAAPAPPVST